MLWLIFYFVIFGIVTFILYGIDKRFAIQEHRRISEKCLLCCSFFSGGLGALLGQKVFHHKTRKKRFFWISVGGFLMILVLFGVTWYHENKKVYTASDFGFTDLTSQRDQDNDGIDDYLDILLGARKDAENHPTYRSEYYAEGYPPDEIGVCTDTVWRAFMNAGYVLRDLVDEDIRNHLDLYPRVANKPDKNIDFRRVKNLKVFFDRKAVSLTTDLDKITEWMPGDIVIFGSDYSHIGILSDKRNKKGIPWLIHNSGQPNREENVLEWLALTKKITGHYRWEGV